MTQDVLSLPVLFCFAVEQGGVHVQWRGILLPANMLLVLSQSLQINLYTCLILWQVLSE